jgi:murein tripeptide amidase MpaA
VAYFAWTYPFSFEETLKKTEAVGNKLFNDPDVYFHREVLCRSLEGRPMELVTITGYDKMMADGIREDLIEGLFPEHEGDQDRRPFRFDKPTIFLTSRVHPGETPASFVLNGILNFLTNKKNEQAKILLTNYVFKIIPALNPDGIYRGYWRLDTLGQNLNRYYIDPSQVK